MEGEDEVVADFVVVEFDDVKLDVLLLDQLHQSECCSRPYPILVQPQVLQTLNLHSL